MRLITRSFDNIPPEDQGYTVYAISTTKPQRYRDVTILWLFVPTYDAQIEYNKTKDSNKLNERMITILKHRASAIEDWVKSNSNAKICLVCWENLASCHRKLVADAIREAGEKAGVSVIVDIG
ncbi:MAG: hypothetical protein A2132_00605 [Nitrospirae bacterium RBG_16_43_11]|nr:MAG: hypothetical protein A2132_00605 [Nitrospirae bacterium RBG_16_43_11]